MKVMKRRTLEKPEEEKDVEIKKMKIKKRN
jgi:hypothetical protein